MSGLRMAAVIVFTVIAVIGFTVWVAITLQLAELAAGNRAVAAMWSEAGRQHAVLTMVAVMLVTVLSAAGAVISGPAWHRKP